MLINVLSQVQYGHIASVSVLVTAKTIITVLSFKRTQKRKLLNDEIEELQKKKRCLQTDIDSLTASADEYAEEAEQTHQVSWITKSNSFRRHSRCHLLPSLTALEDTPGVMDYQV